MHEYLFYLFLCKCIEHTLSFQTAQVDLDLRSRTFYLKINKFATFFENQSRVAMFKDCALRVIKSLKRDNINNFCL